VSRVSIATARRWITALVGAYLPLSAGVSHAHTILDTQPSDSVGNSAILGAVIALAALGYGVGLRQLWHRGARSRRDMTLRAVAFASGLASVGLALLSPLDRWGAQLFALHMVQHEMLMLIAAPLLVLGRPLPLWLWAFPWQVRSWIARVTRGRSVQLVWTTLLAPIVAWLLHALVLWTWHVPRLFEDALRNEAVHDVQHLCFLASALVFWAAMVEARKQAQQGAAIVYLFTTTIHTSVLGALITFAARPWYGAYLQTPRDWGLSALEDQQLGGLIMWVPGSLVYVGVALALLVRWIRASDLGEQQISTRALPADRSARTS
jgi:putative membrane protein